MFLSVTRCPYRTSKADLPDDFSQTACTTSTYNLSTSPKYFTGMQDNRTITYYVKCCLVKLVTSWLLLVLTRIEMLNMNASWLHLSISIRPF